MKKGIFKKIIAFLFAAMFIFSSWGNIVFAADNVSSVEETANVVGSVEPLAAGITIPDGYYYLRNPQTERFVDSKKGNDKVLEQWDYSGDNTQLWIFTRIPSGAYAGYYYILQEQSMLYMTVKDSSDKNDVDVVLSNYISGCSGQAWKIEYTNNGQYKITPACGEATGRVLCVNNSVFGANVNGLDIKSRTYSNDSNYKDEWNIHPSKTTLYLLSRYDSAFYRSFGTESESRIQESENFLKKAIANSKLPITINVSSTIPFISSAADVHIGSPCNNINCGGVYCINHHKNVIRLSNDIWEKERISPNTVIVSWTERLTGELCKPDAMGFHEATKGLLAAVCDHRPIIGIYQTNFAPSQEICGSLTLTHEMAHVFGMDDVYDTISSHKSGKFNCVMMKYDDDGADALYKSIDKDGVSPYCETCIKLIWSSLVTNSFSGNGK